MLELTIWKILARTRLAGDTPRVEVDEAATEAELLNAAEHPNWGEVRKLADEQLDPLFQLEAVAFDLRAHVGPHLLADELSFQVVKTAARVAGMRDSAANRPLLERTPSRITT